jgi:hypothetical protein
LMGTITTNMTAGCDQQLRVLSVAPSDRSSRIQPETSANAG